MNYFLINQIVIIYSKITKARNNISVLISLPFKIYIFNISVKFSKNRSKIIFRRIVSKISHKNSPHFRDFSHGRKIYFHVRFEWISLSQWARRFRDSVSKMVIIFPERRFND